jgi:hypothetical protein
VTLHPEYIHAIMASTCECDGAWATCWCPLTCWLPDCLQSETLYLEVANKLQKEPQAFKPHHVRGVSEAPSAMLLVALPMPPV